MRKLKSWEVKGLAQLGSGKPKVGLRRSCFGATASPSTKEAREVAEMGTVLKDIKLEVEIN